MQHEARSTIRVIDILKNDKFDQYEIEIETSFQTYTCYLRFSELRKIFKNVSLVQVYSCSNKFLFPLALTSIHFSKIFYPLNSGSVFGVGGFNS